MLTQMNKILKQTFTSVNKNQMQNFKGIRNWWKADSQMHVLFQYNYSRVQFIKDTLNLNTFKGVDILDVGCGAGFLACSLARLQGNVLGIDPNPTSYLQAITQQQLIKQELPNLSYLNWSIEELKERKPEQKYDLVAAMDVLQHVDNQQLFIDDLASLVRPGGHLVISTIAKRLDTWFTHILLAQYVTKIVPLGTHQHSQFVNPDQLEKWFTNSHTTPIARLELDLNWKGDFNPTKNGGNYISIALKPIN